MHCRQAFLLVGPLFAAGCLHEGPPPSGHRLFPGQDVEAPGFITIAGETWVRFEDRKSFPTDTKGGVTDIWLSSFDGVRQRKVVANRSDRGPGLGGPNDWADGHHYFLIDESTTPKNADGAGEVQVYTLLRLGPTLEEEIRFEGVFRWTLQLVAPSLLSSQETLSQSCPATLTPQSFCSILLFEKPPAAGQAYPDLLLWDGVGQRVVGQDSGSFQMQQVGSGTLYFILGPTKTLSRLTSPGGSVESLRDNVARFLVRNDEQYVALTVTDGGKTQTLVRDLTTATEIPLVQPNPSSWGGFSGTTFGYLQSRTAVGPAERHSLDLTTGEETVVIVPSALADDLGGRIPRPGSGEDLLLDSQGNGVFVAAGSYTARRSVGNLLLAPKFTDDGQYLLYITPALNTQYDSQAHGPLMIQDAELAQPARLLSPPGLVLYPNGYGGFDQDSRYVGDLLYFSAHLGRANSDLYFANLPSGTLRIVAKSIVDVSISEHSLWGILNASSQDNVGDLVSRDLDHGVDVLYAHAVASQAVLGNADPSQAWVAFAVRGRADSDHSGLWLTTLAPAPTPDGGTN